MTEKSRRFSAGYFENIVVVVFAVVFEMIWLNYNQIILKIWLKSRADFQPVKIIGGGTK